MLYEWKTMTMINSKSYFLKSGAALVLLLSLGGCASSEAGKSTAAEKSGAAGMSADVAKAGDAGKTADAGRSADAGRAAAAGKAANAGESGAAGKSADAGKSAAAGKSADAGKSGSAAAGKSADAGKSGAAGNAANAGQSGAAGKSAPSTALAVNLGTAATYVILAKSGISTVPPSVVTGNVGVSPAAATSITGFSLIADSTNVFSTSAQMTGKVYAADYAPPTPSNLTTAVLDMQLAFADAAGRAPDVTELNGGNIGGMTLAPGIYKWSTGLLIPTNVTLAGSATDVWIFQIAQDLTMSSAAKILLSGGALPKNIFWQVSGLVDLGTTAHCEGVVLTQTAVTLRTGASINGRLLAQTAVNIDTSTVVAP
jgi:hypothetical protein